MGWLSKFSPRFFSGETIKPTTLNGCCNFMKNHTNTAGSILGTAITLLLLITFSSIAMAKPDKPLNAADVQTKKDREGIGCLVRAFEGNDIDEYEYDPTCSSHFSVKRDRHGDVVSSHYHDEGELQPDQEAPSKALIIPLEFGNCSGSEVITPSGNYSSNLRCRN